MVSLAVAMAVSGFTLPLLRHVDSWGTHGPGTRVHVRATRCDPRGRAL